MPSNSPAPVEKIRKLLALAEPEHGGTEAERDAAMAAARKLMSKYDLEAFEIAPGPDEPGDVTHDVLWTRGRDGWRGLLLYHLAEPLACAVVRTRYSATRARWTIIGTPTNVAHAQRLHAGLVPWLETHALRARNQLRPADPDLFMAAFYGQAVVIIRARLELQQQYLAQGQAAIDAAVERHREYQRDQNQAYVEQLFGDALRGVVTPPPPPPPTSEVYGARAGEHAGAAAILSRGELPRYW